MDMKPFENMLLISAFCCFYSLPLPILISCFFLPINISPTISSKSQVSHFTVFKQSHILLLFLSNLFLYLRIIALQNCVGFCQSSTGIIPQSHLAFKLIEQLVFLMGHHVMCDAQIICVPLISVKSHIQFRLELLIIQTFKSSLW